MRTAKAISKKAGCPPPPPQVDRKNLEGVSMETVLELASMFVVYSKVGRNTVTSGGPVTVTVTEPIPCYRR